MREIQIIRGSIKNVDLYILHEPLNFVDKEYKDIKISSKDKIVINYISLCNNALLK